MKYLCLFSLLTCAATAQEDTAFLKAKNIDFFSTDQFGNIYTVQFNQLKKYNDQLEEVFAYSSPLTGVIHGISTLDPMNILLFYKDQGQITVLDNRLSESRSLRFNDYKLNDVQLVSQSDESFLWAYDQASDKLYRLDINNNIVSNKSLTLSQLAKTDRKPVQMESTFEKVFLNIPGTGLLVFDATGTYIQTFPIPRILHFTVTGPDIYYYSGNSIKRLHIRSGRETTLYDDLTGLLQFEIRGDRLFLLRKEGIRILKL